METLENRLTNYTNNVLSMTSSALRESKPAEPFCIDFYHITGNYLKGRVEPEIVANSLRQQTRMGVNSLNNTSKSKLKFAGLLMLVNAMMLPVVPVIPSVTIGGIALLSLRDLKIYLETRKYLEQIDNFDFEQFLEENRETFQQYY